MLCIQARKISNAMTSNDSRSPLKWIRPRVYPPPSTPRLPGSPATPVTSLPVSAAPTAVCKQLAYMYRSRTMIRTLRRTVNEYRYSVRKPAKLSLTARCPSQQSVGAGDGLLSLEISTIRKLKKGKGTYSSLWRNP